MFPEREGFCRARTRSIGTPILSASHTLQWPLHSGLLFDRRPSATESSRQQIRKFARLALISDPLCVISISGALSVLCYPSCVTMFTTLCLFLVKQYIQPAYKLPCSIQVPSLISCVLARTFCRHSHHDIIVPLLSELRLRDPYYCQSCFTQAHCNPLVNSSAVLLSWSNNSEYRLC
jgi:hypothetical protein